jgi:GNAT superfamily N-acetyltransferase
MAMDRRGTTTIRPAAPGDALRIAALSHQLGYPASEDEVRRRLSRIEDEEEHVCFVAVGSAGLVLGWIHVCLSPLVVEDLQAGLGGLVVDEGYRGLGIGRALMRRAEQWARERGCRALQLNTNVVRGDAHSFYESLGYEKVKQQLVFRKALAGEPVGKR